MTVHIHSYFCTITNQFGVETSHFKVITDTSVSMILMQRNLLVVTELIINGTHCTITVNEDPIVAPFSLKPKV